MTIETGTLTNYPQKIIQSKSQRPSYVFFLNRELTNHLPIFVLRMFFLFARTHRNGGRHYSRQKFWVVFFRAKKLSGLGHFMRMVLYNSLSSSFILHANREKIAFLASFFYILYCYRAIYIFMILLRKFLGLVFNFY